MSGIGKSLAFLAVTALLTVHYGFNVFEWINPITFKGDLRDSEAAVISRIVENRRSGRLSYAGMLGWYNAGNMRAWQTPAWPHEHYRFLATPPGGDAHYLHYPSQPGALGWIFGLADFGQSDERSFRLLGALFSALAVSALGFLAAAELGWLAGLLVLAGFFCNRYFVLMAANLYWAPWTLLLPLIAACHYARRACASRPVTGAIVFLYLACLFRFCCGFEFVSTIMLSLLVPVLYFMVQKRICTVRPLLACSAVALAAFISALLIWFGQLAFFYSSAEKAADTMMYTVSKRSQLVDPGEITVEAVYQESLKTPLAKVVQKYGDTYMYPPVKLRHMALLGALLLPACAVWIAARGFSERGRVFAGLLCASLLAWAAPLSWLLLARGHAALHVDMDAVLFMLPAIPVVLASSGVLLGSAVRAAGRFET